MQDDIVKILLNSDDISWKDLLIQLVQQEDMDPWNIDMHIVTDKFIEVVHNMHEADMKVSGKLVLAAALLLKIKSQHYVENDMTAIDAILQDDVEEYYEDYFEDAVEQTKEKVSTQLIPRTPQARTRKVSIYDLVNALQKAMVSKKKQLTTKMPDRTYELPNDPVDITEVIEQTLYKISHYHKQKTKVTFSKLLPPQPDKLDKVYTFIPLLHLENERKIDTVQPKHFDDITIALI